MLILIILILILNINFCKQRCLLFQTGRREITSYEFFLYSFNVL